MSDLGNRETLNNIFLLYMDDIILTTFQKIKIAFTDGKTRVPYWIIKFTVDLVACYSNYFEDCCICDRCMGCSNCEFNFYHHCKYHWDTNNKLFFLHAAALQIDNCTEALEFCAKYDNKPELLISHESFIKQQLLKYKYYNFLYSMEYLKKFNNYNHLLKLAFYRLIDGKTDISDDNIIAYARFIRPNGDLYHTLCGLYNLNTRRILEYYGVGRWRSFHYFISTLLDYNDEFYLTKLYNDVKNIYTSLTLD